LFLGQRNVALYIELSPALDGFGIGELRSGLRQLPLCLIQSRSKWSRIDFEQQLPFLTSAPLCNPGAADSP